MERAQAHRAVLVQSGCARESLCGFRTISVPPGTLAFTPVLIKWDSDKAKGGFYPEKSGDTTSKEFLCVEAVSTYRKETLAIISPLKQ